MSKYEVLIEEVIGNNNTNKKSVTIKMKGKYKNNLVFIKSILNLDLDVNHSPKSTYRNNVTIVKDRLTEGNSLNIKLTDRGNSAEKKERDIKDFKEISPPLKDIKEVKESKEIIYNNNNNISNTANTANNGNNKQQIKNSNKIGLINMKNTTNLKKDSTKNSNKNSNKNSTTNLKEFAKDFTGYVKDGKDVVKDVKSPLTINIKEINNTNNITNNNTNNINSKEIKSPIVNNSVVNQNLNPTLNQNFSHLVNQNMNNNNNLINPLPVNKNLLNKHDEQLIEPVKAQNNNNYFNNQINNNIPSNNNQNIPNNQNVPNNNQNPQSLIPNTKSRNLKTFLQDPKIYQCNFPYTFIIYLLYITFSCKQWLNSRHRRQRHKRP